MMGFVRTVTVCALLGVTAFAAADGGFIAKAKEATPKTPYQRAFVSWKAGKETLIVESVLNGPKGEYAWLVPLPAVPEKVQPCTPGTLESVARIAKPDVKQEDETIFYGSAAVLLFAVLGGLFAAFHKPDGRRSKAAVFLNWICVLALILVAVAIVFPVFAQATSSAKAMDAVIVHQSGQAGVYQYDVVGSKSAADLNGWLSRNGYSLPAKASPVIEKYVRQGWCFAAMKLRHAEGEAAPHPVRFVFPAKLPIYPMALTGATTDKLRLDLFVAVEGLAEVKGLKPMRAMETYIEPRSISGEPSQTSWSSVGHPEIAQHLWPHATVTYLRGDLTDKDMQSDFQIDMADPNPLGEYSAKLYTSKAALFETGAYAMLAAAFLMVVLTFWATRKEFGFGSFVKVFLVVAILSAAGGAAWYMTLETVEAVPVKHRTLVQAGTRAVQMMIRDPQLRGPSPDKLVQAIKGAANAPEEGDVPWGYTVKTNPKGGWSVTLYGPNAEPYVHAFDKKGNPVKEKAAAPKPRVKSVPSPKPGAGARLPGS